MTKRRALVLLALLLVAGFPAWLLLHRSPTIVAACTATAGGSSITLDPEQAANATTIAAEALRQGLPAHAVSVGLAAALQESKLRNLHYGDRDSLGLFQQRPSQGWGKPAQILDPSYAARVFYRGLRRVHSWQNLPIYQAAQRVQRSADGSAYAYWDTASRTLARGLTGQSPAGFDCRYPNVHKATGGTRERVESDLAKCLGRSALAARLTPARGWLVASWLIARAPAYSLNRVTYAGRTWTPRDGWRRHPGGSAGVTFSVRRG